MNEEKSYAIAVLNRRTDGMPRLVGLKLSDLGLNNAEGYMVQVGQRSSDKNKYFKFQ